MQLLTEVFSPEIAMLQKGLSADHLTRYENMLELIPDPGDIADAPNTFERMTMLSHAQTMHREADGNFDIDITMRMVNEYFDHRYRLMSDTDDGTSAAWFEELWLRQDRGTAFPKRQIAYGGRKSRAIGVGSMLIVLSAPAHQHFQTMVRSNHVRLELIRTGLAIERFRIATNRLPVDLDELVPEYIASVPMDDFDTDHPLGYRRLNNGYEVVSTGTRHDDSDDDVILRIDH